MIKILSPDDFIRKNNSIGPISTPQIFMGRNYAYHPQGLMSEDTFGLDASPDRAKSYSWIELNCNVIHPSLFDILNKRIERKIQPLISSEKIYSIGDDGLLVEDPEGELDGFSSFIDNIQKIKFREDEKGGDRNKLIKMIYSNIKKDLFFMSKLIVIPPRYREISIPESPGEKPEIGELNALYRKIIIQSNQLKGVSGPIFDILSYKMQNLIKELYELIRVSVSKKHGIVRNLLLGKRVDFSARAVITPNPELNLGTVGLPFKVACSIFEPIIIYGLVNSPQSKNIPEEFHIAVKEVLGKELDPDLLM